MWTVKKNWMILGENPKYPNSVFYIFIEYMIANMCNVYTWEICRNPIIFDYTHCIEYKKCQRIRKKWSQMFLITECTCQNIEYGLFSFFFYISMYLGLPLRT